VGSVFFLKSKALVWQLGSNFISSAYMCSSFKLALLNGSQVPHDPSRAMALFAQAAAQGHAKAKYHLDNLRGQEL
jgi:TPR repeat protein